MEMKFDPLLLLWQVRKSWSSQTCDSPEEAVIVLPENLARKADVYGSDQVFLTPPGGSLGRKCGTIIDEPLKIIAQEREESVWREREREEQERHSLLGMTGGFFWSGDGAEGMFARAKSGAQKPGGRLRSVFTGRKSLLSVPRWPFGTSTWP